MTIQYTDQMIKNLKSCMNDPIFFMDNFCKISTPYSDDPIPLMLYPYQRDIITTYHENKKVSCLCSRQMGKTLITAAYVLWYSLFTRGKTSMICSSTLAMSNNILAMIRVMVEHLPDYIKDKVVENNRQEMKFVNTSRIFTRACTPSAARGMSISLLVIDEAAYIKDTIMDEFWMAVMPTLAATNGKIIMASTLNTRDDLFYKIRENAEENGFVTCTYNWRDHPSRTEAWRDETIKQIGYKNFYKEHECEIHSINDLYREIEQLRYELKMKP